MTIRIPNKDGFYEVDGISITVRSDTIIIDTGRRTDTARYQRGERRSDRREPMKKKEGSLFNTVMENARDLATGKRKWDEKGR